MIRLAPVFALALLLAAPAAAGAADTTLGFDDLADGTYVTTQYHDVEEPGRGVDFAPSDAPPAVVSATQPKVLASPDAASVPNVLDTSGCAGEFCQPTVTARFTDPRANVTVYPGDWSAGEGATVRLTAYTAAGTEVGRDSGTVVNGSTLYCNFACALTVASANPADPAQLITYFTVTRVSGGRHIGIDDLSFEHPAVAVRTYGLSWSGTIADGTGSVPSVGVRQGYATDTTLRIFRSASSSGAIALGAEAKPSETDVSFDPASTSGSSSTMTVRAGLNAASADGAVRVSGTASDASSSGPSPHLVDVPVSIRPNFAVAGDARFVSRVPRPVLDVPPCTTVSVPVAVFVPSAFGSIDPGLVPRRYTGVVNLAAGDFLTGVSASVNPVSVTLDAATKGTTLFVRRDAGGLPAAQQLSIVATHAPFAPSTGGVLLRPVGGRIESVSPTTGRTPLALAPGTEVKLTGTGFCPGAKVRFGNVSALATPASIAPDGRSLTVRVPRLATTGPLVVTSPGADAAGGPAFTVDSYRNSAGFSFPNFKRTPSFDDLTSFFGADQTLQKLQFNPCSGATFGLLSCGVTLKTIHNPFADQILGWAQDLTGLCVGMSLGSLKLARGDSPLAAYGPAGAGSVWKLQGPMAASPSLAQFLTAQALAQYSSNYISLTAALPHGNAAVMRASLAGMWSGGDAAFIVIRSGDKGHALVAYDVEDDPAVKGGLYIDVYDPNRPFVLPGEELMDGSSHKARVDASRIRVAPDGRWSFPGLAWSGGTDALWVVPYSELRGKLAINKVEVPGLISLGSPEADVVDLEDASDRTLLDSRGEPTSPRLVRFAWPDSSLPGTDSYVLRDAAAARLGVRSKGRRPYREWFRARGFSGEVAASPTGTRDLLTADPRRTALGFAAGQSTRAGSAAAGGGRSAKVSVLAQAVDGSTRTAVLDATARPGGSDSVAFDRARREVTLRHRGPVSTGRLTVGWTGRGGLPGAFSTEQLRLAGDTTLRLRPRSWAALAGGRASLVVRRGRRVSRRTVRDRGRRSRDVTISRVGITPAAQGKRRLSITTRLGKVPRASSLTLVWAVVRGRRTIARHLAALPERALARGSRRTSWLVDLPSGRGYRLAVAAVLVRAGTPTIAQAARRAQSFSVR